MLHRQVFYILTMLVFLFVASKTSASDIQIDSSSAFVLPGYSKKISMDFQDASLVDVLKIFSQQTNLNLISADELSSKRITVFLENVPVEQALEQVLRANNLTYELQPDSNIYIVKPLTKPDTELITRVYLLKHASVSTSRITKTLKISYSFGKGSSNDVTESNTSGSSGSGSSGSGAGGTGTGILGAIQNVLTPKGKALEDARTNSITVTDIVSNFSNIESTIAKLDIPVPQVLIEVEMLEVSKETGDKIGIKWGNTPLTFKGPDREILFPYNQDSIVSKGFTFSSEYTPGVLGMSGLTALLQFIQTQSDTKNLARPRILTLSNQPAQIKISAEEAIGLTTSTTSSQNIATSTSSAERVETGVFLTVTPQVNLADNDITLAVVPNVITTTASSIATGNTSTLRDPEDRGSMSILRIADGDTVMLGGLLKKDKSSTITKVPILSDIPFIGAAFKHADDTIKDRELIIFLTPHILREGLEKTISMPRKPIIREQSQKAGELMNSYESRMSNKSADNTNSNKELN